MVVVGEAATASNVTMSVVGEAATVISVPMTVSGAAPLAVNGRMFAGIGAARTGDETPTIRRISNPIFRLARLIFFMRLAG